jgi:hypothetical protein
MRVGGIDQYFVLATAQCCTNPLAVSARPIPVWGGSKAQLRQPSLSDRMRLYDMSEHMF